MSKQEIYFWSIMRKRKNEERSTQKSRFYNSQKKLPKSIATKSFRTKIQALRFASLNKHRWIQAELYSNKDRRLTDVIVACIDSYGNYKGGGR